MEGNHEVIVNPSHVDTHTLSSESDSKRQHGFSKVAQLSLTYMVLQYGQDPAPREIK